MFHEKLMLHFGYYLLRNKESRLLKTLGWKSCAYNSFMNESIPQESFPRIQFLQQEE